MLVACTPDTTWREWHFTSQNSQPQTNHAKDIGPFQTQRQSTEQLTNTPQNCRDHQKQEQSEKPSQSRAAYGGLETKGHVASRMGFRNRERILDKNQIDLNDIGTWVNNEYQYWFIYCYRSLQINDFNKRGNWVWALWRTLYYFWSLSVNVKLF